MFLTTTLLVGAAGVAFAQDAEVEAPPDLTPAAPAPPPAAPPPPPPPVAPASSSGGRFRWGVGGGLGWHSARAVVFGPQLRMGAQLSDRVGVYGELGSVVGFGLGGRASEDSVAVSVSGVALWYLAPMVELDMGAFFVAGGPLIGRGGWGQVVQRVDSEGDAYQYAIATRGLLPGIQARVGLTTGTPAASGRHRGLSVALDLKLLNARVSSAEQQSGPSGTSQRIETGDRVWGFTPMLTIGYDAR